MVTLLPWPLYARLLQGFRDTYIYSIRLSWIYSTSLPSHQQINLPGTNIALQQIACLREACSRMHLSASMVTY